MTDYWFWPLARHYPASSANSPLCRVWPNPGKAERYGLPQRAFPLARFPSRGRKTVPNPATRGLRLRDRRGGRLEWRRANSRPERPTQASSRNSRETEPALPSTKARLRRVRLFAPARDPRGAWFDLCVRDPAAWCAGTRPESPGPTLRLRPAVPLQPASAPGRFGGARG